MVTRKAILYLALLVIIILVSACQSKANQNRKLAEEAGLPDDAFSYLDTSIDVLEDYQFESIRQASNLTEFMNWDENFIGADEIWCIVIRVDDEFTWYLDLTRRGDSWNNHTLITQANFVNDSFGARDVWREAGCLS